MTETMHERLRWVEHRGLTFLVIDFTNLPQGDQLAVVEAVAEVYYRFPSRTLLVITDITGSFGTRASISKMQELGRKHPARHFAAIGVTGIKKVLAQSIRRGMIFADSVEEAMNLIADRVAKEAEEN
jgi:hypothetical protein